MQQTRITVLVEDSPPLDGLRAEHGLSLWIEADGLRILFDTGQTGIFIKNAERLGIDLSSADAVVLSHGHYDHTGGLACLPEESVKRLYMHPDALQSRYRRMEQPPHKSIGIPAQSESLIRRLWSRVVLTPGPTGISENIGVTGGIPRVTDFEDVGSLYYLDQKCSVPDTFIDDQALWIKTAKGLIVVFGCAHAGVVNTLKYLSSHLKTNVLRAVIGGLHLGAVSPSRIKKTAEELESHRLEFLAAGHCTGSGLARVYRGRKEALNSGSVLVLEDVSLC